jgi:predicted TIM-barrel fold metal-dependent hydrolase
VIFDSDMLSPLIKKAGIDNVMMGSDYPRGEVEENPISFIETSLNMSQINKDKIMGINAKRLFNLTI